MFCVDYFIFMVLSYCYFGGETEKDGRRHLAWVPFWILHKIPCECGKVYIGKTGRAMQDRIKEHDRDIRLARTQTSAVSEHANETGHLPIWKEVKFIDRDPH